MRGSKKRKNPRKCRRCRQTVTAPEEIRPGGLICLECQAKRNRKRAKEWYGQHSDVVIARSMQWKRDHPEKVREHRDAYMERVKADPAWFARYMEGRRLSWEAWHARHADDPEWAAARRAQQREHHRAKRIELGLPVREISDAEYRRRYGSGYGQATRVSPEPLLPFLQIVAAEGDVMRLADDAGVSPDLIWDLLHEARNPIALVTADRLCTALDLPMGIVYVDEAA
jgi:hypothetical protein